MNEFLQMGGYAIFVWPAYLAVITVVLVLGVQSWRSQKVLTAEAAGLKQAAGEATGNEEQE